MDLILPPFSTFVLLISASHFFNMKGVKMTKNFEKKPEPRGVKKLGKAKKLTKGIAGTKPDWLAGNGQQWK